MMMVSFVLFFLQFLGVCFASCHYPNGNRAGGDFPCDPDAKDSVCCGGGTGSVCLSSKLCSNGNGNLVRGSCTDKTWTSPECSYHCVGPDVGPDLISCSNVTGDGISYCCDHAPGCCNSGVGRFPVYPEKPRNWATFNTISSRFIVVGTKFSDDLTTSSIPSSSSVATTSASSSKPTSATPSTTSTSASASASTSTSSSTSSSAISSGTNLGGSSQESPNVIQAGLSTGAIAGIAVAGGVSIILVLVAAFLFWRSRQGNSKTTGLVPKPHEASAYAYQNSWDHGDRQYNSEHYGYFLPKEPQEVDGRPFRAELADRRQ